MLSRHLAGSAQSRQGSGPARYCRLITPLWQRREAAQMSQGPNQALLAALAALQHPVTGRDTQGVEEITGDLHEVRRGPGVQALGHCRLRRRRRRRLPPLPPPGCLRTSCLAKLSLFIAAAHRRSSACYHAALLPLSPPAQHCPVRERPPPPVAFLPPQALLLLGRESDGGPSPVLAHWREYFAEREQRLYYCNDEARTGG